MTDNQRPFFKTIPYRHLTLDVIRTPFPQENGDDWTIEDQTMNDYDLFVCESGSAIYRIGSDSYHLQPDMMLLVPPGKLVSARKSSREPLRMIAQHFMLYVFNRTDLFSLFSYAPLVRLTNRDLCRRICHEIRLLHAGSGGKYQPFETTPLFMVLLKEFLQEAFIAEEFIEERKSTLILRILQLIDIEYRSPRLLERIMNTSPYGYSHTANLFRQYTGQSIRTYIIERRLEASKEVIMRGGSVAEGAAAAGYEDVYYFSRIFKKYAGCSPRTYRTRI